MRNEKSELTQEKIYKVFDNHTFFDILDGKMKTFGRQIVKCTGCERKREIVSTETFKKGDVYICNICNGGSNSYSTPDIDPSIKALNE